jgi:hypothetical protein
MDISEVRAFEQKILLHAYSLPAKLVTAKSSASSCRRVICNWPCILRSKCMGGSISTINENQLQPVAVPYVGVRSCCDLALGSSFNTLTSSQWPCTVILYPAADFQKTCVKASKSRHNFTLDRTYPQLARGYDFPPAFIYSSPL